MVNCSVLLCSNNSVNSNKASSGITFHVFPKMVNSRLMWIKSTGREDWIPPKRAVICSAHFEESCFYYTAKGLIKLVKGSIPTRSLPTVKCESPSTSTQDLEIQEAIDDDEEEVEEESEEHSRTPSPTSNAQWFVPAEISTSSMKNMVVRFTSNNADLRKLSDRDTHEERRLKWEINRLDNVIQDQRRRLKTLRQKDRRNKKKIQALGEILENIKKEKFIENNSNSKGQQYIKEETIFMEDPLSLDQVEIKTELD